VLSWLAHVVAPVCLWADVKKLQIDKNSPEGQYIELVALEFDAAKKLALLEHFLAMFPKANAGVTAWVYGELQDRYRKAGALDKAMAAGEKALAFDPDNLEAARVNWRIAESKQDPELTKKWMAETARIAERMVKTSMPADPDVLQTAQEVVAFTRQTAINADYEDYNRVLQIKDAAQKIAAAEALSKKSPRSPYLNQLELVVFQAWKDLGDVDKAVAVAEKILTHDEDRDDVVLFVAEVNFRRRKDTQRTVALANKFIAHAPAAVKPADQSEADWNRARNQNLMMANYIVGGTYFQAQQWAAADKPLRAALAMVQDEQFRARLLYDLGWANYQMRNAIEAIRLYRLCAAIPGPMQADAQKNVLYIKSEYGLP
jgi:tetratricopeptide (TPR) repeat protein